MKKRSHFKTMPQVGNRIISRQTETRLEANGFVPWLVDHNEITLKISHYAGVSRIYLIKLKST